MAVILDQEVVRTVKELSGEAFYDTSLPTALKNAQKFAGKIGFVASLPQLVQGRIVAPSDNEVWKNLYTANSEENVGKTEQGNNVLIVVHGGGIWTPKRIEQAYQENLTPQYAGKLSKNEIKNLLAGKLADETLIPVFSYEDFTKQSKLPIRYAVVLDFDTAKKTESGYQNADKLVENALFVVRAGGIEQATAYVKKAKEVYKSNNLGNWHPLNNIDTNQEQGRVLFLNDVNGGFSSFIDFNGRFVGVAPEALEARAKNLVAPKLEQILKSAKGCVPEVAWKDFEERMSAFYK